MKNKQFTRMSIICFGLLIFFSTFTQKAIAVVKTCASGGNWGTAATWAPIGVPTSSDYVILASNKTLTIDVNNAVCAKLTVNYNGSNNTTATITFSSSGNQLTVSGRLTLGNTGTHRSGDIDMTNGGTLIVNNLVDSSNNTSSTLTPGTGTIQIKDTTFLPAGTGFDTYNNLTIFAGASATISLGKNTTINGNLDIEAGVLDVTTSSFNLTVSGNFTNYGSFTARSGKVTMNGSFAQNFDGSSGGYGLSALAITNTATAGVTMKVPLSVGGNLTGPGKLSTGSNALNLAGTFTISTFNAGTSTVTFSGSNQGIGNYTFYNLTINNSNSGGTNTLSGDVIVNDTLSFSNGVTTQIVLGTNNLTIGSSGRINGYNATAFININSSGVLAMTADHTNGTVFPVGATGYNPVTIRPASGNAAFTVSVNNVIKDNSGTNVSNATGHAVKMTWFIIPTAGSVGNVFVTAQWNSGDELGTFNRSTARVLTRTGTTTGTWGWASLPTFSGSGPFTLASWRLLLASGNNSFSIVDGGSALPVTLISFNAAYENNRVNLNWATASEINNHYFNVQRSVDGENWQNISQVEGHGNSITTQNYFTTDDLAGVVPAGTLYYRLQQVDFNGATAYSMIRSVNINHPIVTINTAPNPTTGTLNITWTSMANDQTVLKIIDITGAALYTENVSGMGIMYKQIDMATYPTGTYFVQLVSGKNINTQTVIKQ